MKRFLKHIALLFVLLALGVGAQAQSVASLKEQIRKAEAEIKKTNELLKKTQSDKRVSQRQLNLIRTKINSRKEIVSALDKQIILIDKEIEAKNAVITELSGELNVLRKEYADMVYDSYKNYKLNNFILFLFASDDFNEATRRIDMMRRYNQVRETKAGEIQLASDSIATQIAELGRKQEELKKAKDERTAELTSLGKDEGQYKKSVEAFRKQESNLDKKMRDRQKEIAAAQKKLAALVASQAKKDNSVKVSAAEQKKITELSGRFDQNRGKLPSPLSGGVVTEKYGKHAHPMMKNEVIDSHGINITGAKGAAVTCVFEGEVSMVAMQQGYNNTVLVRHGNYITLYSNLQTIAVKKGDKVSLNQRIGTVPSGGDNSFLHFEVWKYTSDGKATHMDPQTWLAR